MKYKPENVKLVITHEGVEQEVVGFDESTCCDEYSDVSVEQIECVFHRVSKKLKPKSSRCKDTIDWFNVAYILECKKAKKGESGY